MAVRDERHLSKPGASVDLVIGRVLTQIGSGELGPGEQLRQGELAETLGVSRVPVREALHALAEQRVLVHEKHRGFFVAKRNSSELAQFARMLELIEAEVIATIEWPSPDLLGRLRSLNEELLAAAEDQEATRTFALNREFHFLVFGLSPNTVMIDELDRLWRLAQPHIIADMITPEARRSRVQEHRAIIDRLEMRDLRGVADTLARHRRRSGPPLARRNALADTPPPSRPPAPAPVTFLSPAPTNQDSVF